MTSNADTLQLFCQIQAQQGARKAVTVDKNVTATALRQEVSKTTSIPLDKLRLIFRGRMIKDEDTKPAIEEYRLEGDAVLHCMGNPEVTTTATTTTTTDAAPGVATSTNTNGTSTTAANAVSSAAAAAAVSVPPLSTTTVSNPVAVAVAAATSSSGASAAAAPPSDPVAVALMRLRASNAPSVYKTAVETLLKVLTNIADKPMDEKYRKVKRGNAVFQKRLGGVPGGHEAMLAVGFVVETDAAAGDGGGEVYQLHASAEQWPKLMQSKDRVSEAVALVQQHQPSQSGASFGAAAAGVPAMPFGAAAGFGGGGMPNPMDAAGMMNDPAAQSAMLQMMSDPQSLQAALQNPMVQNMMRNDPNVPPHMRQHMEQLANNPDMLNMMAQSMQDPNVRAQMQQAMQMRGAMGGGMPGMPNNNALFGGGQPAANSGTNAAQPQQGQQPGGDQSQTEEEMIAEAIRRSLEDS